MWLRALAGHRAPSLSWWGVTSLPVDRLGSPKNCNLVFLKDPGDSPATEQQGNSDRRSSRSLECSGLQADLGGLSHLHCGNHSGKQKKGSNWIWVDELLLNYAMPSTCWMLSMWQIHLVSAYYNQHWKFCKIYEILSLLNIKTIKMSSY